MNRPEKKRVIRMMAFPSVELSTAGIRNLAAVGLIINLFRSFHWRNLGIVELGSVDPGFFPSPHTSPTPNNQGASPNPEESSHSSSSRLQDSSQVLQ